MVSAPCFEIRYSDTGVMKGWYFVFIDSKGVESNESSVFADDGMTIGEDSKENIDPSDPYFGKPRGEALAIQCAMEDFQAKVEAGGFDEDDEDKQ